MRFKRSALRSNDYTSRSNPKFEMFGDIVLLAAKITEFHERRSTALNIASQLMIVPNSEAWFEVHR